MSKTAIEIVDIYLRQVWNERRVDLVREICADPIVRHDPGAQRRLSHDEQIERISSMSEGRNPIFTDVVFHGDDQYVTSVWNMLGDNGAWSHSGIEVFKVIDGRITDVWNGPYTVEHWG